MRPVIALIFHQPAAANAGPLVRGLATARLRLAERQRAALLAAGADRAVIVAGAAGLPFGERLAAAVAVHGPARGGLIAMGSGSIPLARLPDLRRFVETAAGHPGRALANNRFSADVVALSRTADLDGLPAMPSDNALPRWLEEVAGTAVADLRARWRLGFDLDSPADLIVLERAGVLPAALRTPTRELARLAGALEAHLDAVAAVLRDRRAELLVAGRVAGATLRALEDAAACRVRALVEERGLRAASALAQASSGQGDRPELPQRPPRSVLGELLDRDGPAALGGIVAGLAEAAVVDSRVLLAHRCGADEAAWPSPEDRFASDLLLSERIADPWLRALTEAAASGPVPTLLGGHTLLNGGLRLLLPSPAPAPGPRRRVARDRPRQAGPGRP